MASSARKRVGYGRRGTDVPAFAPWALAFLSVILIELGRAFFGGTVTAAVVKAQYEDLKVQLQATETRLTKRVDRVEDALRDHTDRTAIR
jgi:hypothetical protein